MAQTRQEDLGGGIIALVNDEYAFGTDALLLAAFAAPKKKDTVCDFGTGCGILPLLWCREQTPVSVTAVDIQHDACALVNSAIALNNLETRLRVVCADIRDKKAVKSLGHFDLVTMNPPYYTVGSGFVSRTEAARTARHETACSFEDAASAAEEVLRFGGRFCLCFRPERLCDAVCALRASGLEPKRMRFVAARAGKVPRLTLLEARKGGRPGLRVLPTLYLHESDGSYTREAQTMYGDYRRD